MVCRRLKNPWLVEVAVENRYIKNSLINCQEIDIKQAK
jgi:hypothetical protein